MSEKHIRGWELRRQKYGPTGRPPGAATNAVIADADYLVRWKARCIINDTGCWLWQGFVHHNGYGGTGFRGKSGRTHRFSYEIHRGGPPPKGWDVCHTCDNRRCINPLHLFAAPRAVNVEDMRAKGRGNNQKKTHCPKGHSYAEHGESPPGHPTWRKCKICERERLASPKYREWAKTYHRQKRQRNKVNELGKEGQRE